MLIIIIVMTTIIIMIMIIIIIIMTISRCLSLDNWCVLLPQVS